MLGRGRAWWFQLRWLSTASCESGRVNQIERRTGGLRMARGEEGCRHQMIMLFEVHSTVIPEMERTPHPFTIFVGDHLDCVLRNILWSPGSLQLWWEGTHGDLAIREIGFIFIGFSFIFIQITPLPPFWVLPFMNWISELLFLGTSHISSVENIWIIFGEFFLLVIRGRVDLLGTVCYTQL